MIGAIIGDIVGSRFEFNNHRSTDFELFHKDCSFTDDTICTVAVAEWLIWVKENSNLNRNYCMLQTSFQPLFCCMFSRGRLH